MATKKGRSKIGKVMREYKTGGLKSSSGKKVKSRKQAVAIALSEARESGAPIPKKGAAKAGVKKKSGSRKKTARGKGRKTAGKA